REGFDEIVGHVAAVRSGIGRAGGKQNKNQRGEASHDPVTPSKPSFVADGGGLPPRRSISLYPVIIPPTAPIMAMPIRLTAICIAMRPEISVSTKWAENDKNTPRQKISSEC